MTEKPNGIRRAYSVIEVKSFDEDERTIEGIASTPVTDRMDDIVESAGAEYKVPMPLLWQHRSDPPVGNVEHVEVRDDGIRFRARIANIPEPGELQNVTNKTWQSIKHGLVRGMSIGFRDLESEPIDPKKGFWGGTRFKKWEWLELSVVTIPANADATIQTIRSIDAAMIETIEGGAKARRSEQIKPVVKLKETKIMAKKSTADHIREFEATRQAKAARMVELMDAANEAGTTLEAEPQTEYDALEAEIKTVDEHLRRLHVLEATTRAAARPVNGNDQASGSASRAPGAELELATRANPVISVKRNVPPEMGFVRRTIAILAGHQLQLDPYIIAKQRWGESQPEIAETLKPETAAMIKAAVAAGTTTDSTWAGPLINYQILADQFLEFLRPMTLLGNIPGLRRVPFNIQIPAQTQGSLAAWVGEGVSKPVSKLAFTSLTLRWAKAANIMVLTDELVRFSSPSAEAIVRDDLAAGMAQFLDQQFITPSVTAVTNVSPASISNGAPNSAASGVTADNVRQDFKAAIASFTAANIPFSGIVLAMNTNLAASLGMMHNALGQPEFPTLSSAGGSLMGIPVVVSDNVPSGTIFFIKASEILLADDGGVDIAVSREASLQLDTAPATPPTTMVSLFQQNMVALRVERYITWLRRRTQSVYYLTGANYGTVVST